MNYEKCGDYPQCTFAECSCYDKALYKSLMEDAPNKKLMFKLIKDFHEYKKGGKFDSFDGLVSGIHSETGESIRFDNKDYFKIV